MIDFPSGQKMAAEPNPAPMFVANRYKALDYVFEVIYVYLLCMLCHTHFNLFNRYYLFCFFLALTLRQFLSFFEDQYKHRVNDEPVSAANTFLSGLQ